MVIIRQVGVFMCETETGGGARYLNLNEPVNAGPQFLIY